ncbi:Hypothetical predicted protein [Olea europaea subsp. europaea]|uniref:Uncharacterized protein n=1 Tax=Olea europaea subsp. europaea TaxID=158383 RepID=A0A8S0R622_OLEEU|nr:Hypothetical predicted protein [Olea europaea subsp. europaea]
MASVIPTKEEGRMTLHECVDDLLSTGLVEAGDELHIFALWFLRNFGNRVAYSTAKTSELRYKWIGYCFERDKMPGFESRFGEAKILGMIQQRFYLVSALSACLLLESIIVGTNYSVLVACIAKVPTIKREMNFDAPTYCKIFHVPWSRFEEMTDTSCSHTSSETDCDLVLNSCSDDGSDEDVLQQLKADMVSWLQYCRITERMVRQ